MQGINKKHYYLFVLGILFVFNILAWIVVYDFNKPKYLEVTFFDVGQGDSIFIQTPRRTQILIDGGPSSRVIEKLSKVQPFYDRSLDFIISSHPDSDHLVGLVDVLKIFKVNLIGSNGTISSNPEFAEWQTQISKNNISPKVLKLGQRILVGKNLYFEVLAPLISFENKEVSDFNTSSVVLRMVYKNNSFLFTGDASKTIEEKIASTNQNIKTDVLKVSHHGSKTSTSDKFLKAVNPEIAVIEVGKNNRYGHPHQEVLERLKTYAIKILRTDELKDIKIISNGEFLKIIN